MKNAINSVVVAFSEILKWNSIKIVIASGVIVSVFWAVVGYLLWDNIVAIGSSILEYIPFSMVKSNGAWMLSAFLWFQLTLITFAIIYAFFGNLIIKKIPKEKYSYFTFLTIILSAIFWGIVWFFVGDKIYEQFLKLFTWLPFETIEKGLASIIALYIIYNAIVVSMLFVASIFSRPIVKTIENKENIVHANAFKSLKYTIKDTLIFLLLSIIAFPLLFIPVINIFIQIALWLWLFKDTLSFDAISMVYEN